MTHSPHRHFWTLPDDVVYLNHGSFGPSPLCVQQSRAEWSARLERQPMNFFLREMESALDAAAERLAGFVGTSRRNLVFVDNATAGMNIVAASVPLQAGDEILLTDHEYGAVQRLWRRRCQHSGAKLVVGRLPEKLNSVDEVCQQLFSQVTECTRLIVISHVTSPTAVVLPVAKVCEWARQREVPVCIDGPHALAMRHLQLDDIGCDFYTASCHKWLCAPFGSGFLYAAPKWQSRIEPAVVSWGGSVGNRPASWQDEFRWIGTRDPAAFLAVPAAIEFLEAQGLEDFRVESHALAQYAHHRIANWTGQTALIPDDADWYGSMIALPLPNDDVPVPQQGHRDPLQDRLWNEHQIEVPIIHWHGRRFVRVSCHLYNCREDVDRLIAALQRSVDV